MAAKHSAIQYNFDLAPELDIEFVQLFADRQELISINFVFAWALGLGLVFGWPLVMLLLVVCSTSNGR